MHGLLSAGAELEHSVTARSLVSPDLGPAEERREVRHDQRNQDGLRRQLKQTLSQTRSCRQKFQCEDFEVDRASPAGTTGGGSEIFHFASMLSSEVELSHSTVCRNVLSIAAHLPDKDDFRSPPSDSTVTPELSRFLFPADPLTLISPLRGRH